MAEPRVEAFAETLPSHGISVEAAAAYREAAEAFESSLGPGRGGRFTDYEIRRFLAQRRRGGAAPAEVRNLEVACRAYLDFCRPRWGTPAPAVRGGTPPAGAPPVGARGPTPPPTRRVVAPAPAVTTQEVRRLGLLLGGAVLALLVAGASCAVDYARGARALARFERRSRDEARRAADGDAAALRVRVLEAGRQAGVRVDPARLRVTIGPLSSEVAGRLSPDEAMRASLYLQRAGALQQQHVAGLARGDDPTPTPSPDAAYYVEVSAAGEVRGLFGRRPFEVDHHVLAGEGLTAPP